MLDARQITNPSNQNEALYELAVLDARRRPFRKSYHYYIETVTFNIDKLAKFQTAEIDCSAQMGVLILQDWCHSIFQKLDMRNFSSRNILAFSINKWNIHKCFNDKLQEMKR